VKTSELSLAEKEILGLIKSLTERKAYGKVEIVIRAGELTHAQASETIVLSEGNGRTKTETSTVNR